MTTTIRVAQSGPRSKMTTPFSSDRNAGSEVGTAGGPGRLPVLYLCCSSFSGSTLLSFLLNTHPLITTVGHTIGWRYDPEETFHCSCGQPMPDCPFWISVAEAFKDAGLPFEFYNFGTDYKLLENSDLNRYLTAQLPRFRNDTLERLRDRLVSLVPPWARTLARQDRANTVLMRAALAYSGSRVYADNSHSPFRMQRLARIPDLDLFGLYLVRDIRATVYSHMKNHQWGVEAATRVWLTQQSNILRLSRGIDRMLAVNYDDLCDETDATLARIHGFVGLPPAPASTDFGRSEHHILGNVMRLGEKKIAKDQRWKSELTSANLDYIRRTTKDFMDRSPNHPLSNILRQQFERETA